MPPEQDLPESQPGFEPPPSPQHPSPDQQPHQALPTFAASIRWLLAFFVLFFIAAMAYIIGYGAVLGFEYAAQGASAPPQAEIEAAVQQYLSSPGGIAGLYLVQFIVLMPAIIFASHFQRQHWQQTLGLRDFNLAALKYWIAILLGFLGCEFLINQIFDIDQGEFLESVSGSKHLFLSLVIILFAPLLEELIFRGYLFKAWRNTRLGLSGTLLLTSILFSSLHIGQYDGILLVMLFVFSIVLGLARERTGSVWVPIILHSLNNLVSVITVVYLGLI